MGSMALAPPQGTASARGSPNPASTNDRASSLRASGDAPRSAEGCNQRPLGGRGEREEPTRRAELGRDRPDDERWWRSTTQGGALEAFRCDGTWRTVFSVTPSGPFNESVQQGGVRISAGAASATSVGAKPIRGAAVVTVETLREAELEKRSRGTPCGSPLPPPSREGHLGDHQPVPEQPCQRPPLNKGGEEGGVALSQPSSSLIAERGSEEAGVGIGVSYRDVKGLAVGARRGDILSGNHHDEGGVSARGETMWSRRRKQKEAEEAAARKEAARTKKMRAEMVLEVQYMTGCYGRRSTYQ